MTTSRAAFTLLNSTRRRVSVLVLLQHDNYGFSIPVEYHRNALRVNLSKSMVCVAPLAKGTAIACEARLAMNLDKLTELAIIMLQEH